MGLLKDVIIWNVMIGGYVFYGYVIIVIDFFEVMKRKRVQLIYIIFILVLNVCVYVGLLDEGRKYFVLMVLEFEIKFGSEYYVVLVDIVGRYGQVQEVLVLINSMFCKFDKVIWGVFLGVCRMYNNVELVWIVVEKLLKFELESSVFYILFYNMFVDVE